MEQPLQTNEVGYFQVGGSISTETCLPEREGKEEGSFTREKFLLHCDQTKSPEI